MCVCGWWNVTQVHRRTRHVCRRFRSIALSIQQLATSEHLSRPRPPCWRLFRGVDHGTVLSRRVSTQCRVPSITAYRGYRAKCVDPSRLLLREQEKQRVAVGTRKRAYHYHSGRQSLPLWLLAASATAVAAAAAVCRQGGSL